MLTNFVNTEFLDPSDPNIIPFGKGKKPRDVRWATCPVGKGFIVPVEESLVRAGKQRPTIPAQYAGQYRTKAVQHPVWGYFVDHICN